MKNRFSLVLVVSLLTCSNVFGGWDCLSAKILLVADKLNVPIETVLSEGFNSAGKVGGWHRVPKLLTTGLLAYFTWNNKTVRKVASKVAEPVKRAMCCKGKKCTKKDALKKRVDGWQEEEATA